MSTTTPVRPPGDGKHVRRQRLRPVPWSRWVALCAAAEAVGMTAASAAATLSNHAIGEPTSVGAGLAVVGLAVAGGAVEGLALSRATWVGLGARGTGLTRRRWTVATTTAAVVGWGAGMAPSAFAGGSSSGSSRPPWLLVLAGALTMGLAMGALLGIVQARLLRGHVAHHRRWVQASCWGWAPAMAVIFVGATAPDTSWPPVAVVATGLVTGAVAGAVLGAVTGLWLPSLDGPPVRDLVVLSVLRSRVHSVLSGSLMLLRLHGRSTGRLVVLPVQYAGCAGDAVALVAGHAESKQWWRNLLEPRPVDVRLRGTWRTGTAVVLAPDDPRYAATVASYLARWPRAAVTADTPVVLVELASALG